MPSATDTLAIRARGLKKRFGDVVAVDGLDLETRAGTCLGLLGPNGAGKTTTIEMLEGLRAPDAGEIELLGLDWKSGRRELRERIGVQLQQTDLPDRLRVYEVLRLFARLYRDARGIDEVLEQVGLEEKRRALVMELSGGQKQRLSLGCALLSRPDLLFLDEPTTGLDPQARRRVWEIVAGFKANGGTVLLTTHYMEEAERLADELLIVDHGRELVRGTPEAIRRSIGAESILELELGDADSPALPADLAERVSALPDVLSARVSEHTLRVSAQSFERALPEILALLASLSLAPSDLNVHRPTLEDVFVSLTGRQLRDA